MDNLDSFSNKLDIILANQIEAEKSRAELVKQDDIKDLRNELIALVVRYDSGIRSWALEIKDSGDRIHQAQDRRVEDIESKFNEKFTDLHNAIFGNGGPGLKNEMRDVKRIFYVIGSILITVTIAIIIGFIKGEFIFAPR